jgi:hypothetical protein
MNVAGSYQARAASALGSSRDHRPLESTLSDSIIPAEPYPIETDAAPPAAGGFGWPADLPDIRDYTLEHSVVRASLAALSVPEVRASASVEYVRSGLAVDWWVLTKAERLARAASMAQTGSNMAARCHAAVTPSQKLTERISGRRRRPGR